MLVRHRTAIGAAVLFALGLLYMVIALATGHSARAELPPNLAPTEAGLDVWRALALLVDHPSQVSVVDVRPEASFALYHVPGARNLPGASPEAVRAGAQGQAYLLVVGESDAKTAELVGALGAGAPEAHFLKGGAADWYLSLELPTPLFSSKPPPFGYEDAMRTVRSWLVKPAEVPAESVRKAIATLATLAFVPDQLAGKKKAPAGSARKKISGGCG
jgi:rhodanese-related sulfurtransferase